MTLVEDKPLHFNWSDIFFNSLHKVDSPLSLEQDLIAKLIKLII